MATKRRGTTGKSAAEKTAEKKIETTEEKVAATTEAEAKTEGKAEAEVKKEETAKPAAKAAEPAKKAAAKAAEPAKAPAKKAAAKAAEPAKAEEVAKVAEESVKAPAKKPAAKKAAAKKATAKTAEPKKVEEAAKPAVKAEAPKKAEEVVKEAEPVKIEETKKAAEPKKTEKPAKAEEPAKTEEPKKVEEVKKPEKKKLLFVSPEVQPFAGTGGLGEVAGSLPVALARKHKLDVTVILPYYRDIPQEWKEQCSFVKWFYVNVAWRSQYCGIFELKRNGVRYLFVDNEYYFGREGLYGYYDDGERYAFFCKAVMESMHQLDYYPDLVHANDWQTALVPIYNTCVYHYGFKSIFTIHNIAYQGQYDLAILGDVFDLPPEAGAYVEYHGCINLMKGAIEASNIVSTVSPSYAEELQNGFYSEGMEDIIRRNSFKLRGILNGINTTVYDPEKDPEIAENFSAKDLSGKTQDKLMLQSLVGLPQDPDTPVLAIISRLVNHKGMSMIRDIMENLLQERMQLVVLGVGDIQYEEYFRYLQGRYPEKVSANIMFNGGLSHRIYAGADIFLMPSISEPCGLAQMISSRYGTVPVVRETGGLKDSIHDCSLGEGNGFTFSGTDAYQLEDAVRRALALYWKKEDWTALQKYIMNIDFSWRKSASEYEDMYHSLIEF